METASILGFSLGIPVNILSIVIIVIGLILFITEWIPIPVTGLILSILMGITGCMSMEDIYSGFSSSAFIMLLGLLVVGDSLFATGLAEILGKKLTTIKALRNEKTLFAVLFVVTGCFSAFFSNSATIAMLIPICASIVASSNGKLQNKYYIMGIGVAGVIGGTLTLVGSVPQVIANGIIMSAGYDSLGFFDFAKVSGPCIIVALIYFLTVGFSIQKKVLDFDDVSPVSQEYLEQNKGDENSGKLTRPMILSACVFIFCAICFVTGLFPIAVTALIGAAVLFATKAMDFKTTMRNLDWNALIVVAASTSFATGLNASGGGELIAETVLGFFGGENASVTVLLIVGVLISAILGQVMSMTAIVSTYNLNINLP